MIEIKGIKIKFPKWKWWHYFIIIITIICLLKGDMQMLRELIAILPFPFN